MSMESRTNKKRKTWNLVAASLFTLHFSLFIFSCTSETYDSGDGEHSYLRADFVEAHTIAAKQVDYAISDEGERIVFNTPFAVSWTEKADTFYRALLYYNRHPQEVKPLSLQPVYVLRPQAASRIENPKFDPVTLESVWLSKQQLQNSMSSPQLGGLRGASHYLNVSFLIKTGKPDEKDARQSIGIMSEEDEDGHLRLILLHDQGNVPQYYSSRAYASIPIDGNRPITLVVNTYDKGNVSYNFFDN